MKSSVFVRSSQHHIRQYGSVSITEGAIWKGLLSFFFPILFGTFFQQLYNAVDAVVVGRFVGKVALAAVGGGTAVFVNLVVGFFVGLTSGAGVLISQFYGAKHSMEVSLSVHTAFALCLAGGVAMTALGMGFTVPILYATKTPPEIFSESVRYLRIYFCGLVPMFIYNMGSSIFRAAGNSRTPLFILVIGCMSNIVLDVLFVTVFHLGVRGVAFATVVCQVESAAIVLVLLARSKESIRFEPKKLSFTAHLLREIVRIGFPAGIQSCLYTASNLIIQSNINSFGTNTVAAWAAYGKVDAIFWMTVNAFGIAVTTFSGQNFGAHAYNRIKKATVQTLLMTMAATILFVALLWFFGRYFLLLFTGDEAVISEGLRIMHFLMPFWVTYISIEILSGTVRGCGASLVPTVITVFGVCVLRLAWLFWAVPFRNTVIMVLSCYPITWTVTSVAFWVYYLKGTWLRKPEDQNQHTQTQRQCFT